MSKEPDTSKIIREVFDEIDVDHDGFLSEEEVQQVVGRLNLPKRYGRRIFETADSNHDGKVTFEEMQDFVESKMQRLQSAFSYFDKNGNGLIDKSEVYQVLQELYLDLTEEDAELLLQEMDKNNDGNVNFVEFLRMFALLEPIDLLQQYEDISAMFELGSTTDFAAAAVMARSKFRMTKKRPGSHKTGFFAAPAPKMLVPAPAYDLFLRLGAGGVAAVIAQACCQPIETIKVRL